MFNIIFSYIKTKYSNLKTKLKLNLKNNSNDLTNISYKDTIEYIIPLKKGKVIKVYDGDTITIASKLPYDSNIYRFSVRLSGIDCPEINGKGISDEEKEYALIVKNYLSNLILNKEVELKNIKNEKYGRVLADVYLNKININQLLLTERYAVKYDGKTKIKPVSWLKYNVSGDMY